MHQCRNGWLWRVPSISFYFTFLFFRVVFCLFICVSCDDITSTLAYAGEYFILRPGKALAFSFSLPFYTFQVTANMAFDIWRGLFVHNLFIDGTQKREI